MKAAKTRRQKSLWCSPTSGVVAKKTPSVFFFSPKVIFQESQKSIFTKCDFFSPNGSSQLGRFFHFLTFPPLGLCLRLTHWEAAETFSDLLMQLPPGRLRCSALLNRAPLGRSSWELRFRGYLIILIEVGRTCRKIHVQHRIWT